MRRMQGHIGRNSTFFSPLNRLIISQQKRFCVMCMQMKKQAAETEKKIDDAKPAEMTSAGHWEKLSPAELRQSIREGLFHQQTSGCAPGFVQVNVVILPKAYAFDFLLFCQRNPKSCPLLEVIYNGRTDPCRLAPGANIYTDVPKYKIFKDGEFLTECHDLEKEVFCERGGLLGNQQNVGEGKMGGEEFVTFLLGCSFSFEQPLMDAGLNPRNVECHVNVPMYRTNMRCRDAGVFQQVPMVVSMRPYSPSDAIRATTITANFPEVHGSPVHFGDPSLIGITDINKPDYGDRVPLRPTEVPVFWACGVTPQEAILRAKLPVAITHAPGHMFVTDIQGSEMKKFIYGF